MNEKQLCTQCNGSGEGMHDGSTCTTCKGLGVEPEVNEIDIDDYL